MTTEVVAILVDRQGVLWLPSNQGIFRLTLKEANDLADGKLATMSPFAYGLAEGMKISECNGGNPGAVQARDGRLWVPTMRGVVAIDPNAIAPPPPVIVEEVWGGSDRAVTKRPVSGRRRHGYGGVPLHGPRSVCRRTTAIQVPARSL